MATSFFLRLLAIAAALLAVAPAHAEGRAVAQLKVTVEVVVGCRFDASVPRIGAPNRASGTASFSVKCSRGANTSAGDCVQPCATQIADSRHTSEPVIEDRDDGIRVATILF